MKQITALAVAVALSASPSLAEDSEMKEGADLLAQGAQLFFKGLMAELEPQFQGLEGLLNDFSAYHAPEVLPNGDIIIRRKTPLEIEPGEDGEIEL